MKQQIPINTASQTLCRTIKAQYGKNGCANFYRQDGMGATAILEIDEVASSNEEIEMEDENNADRQLLALVGLQRQGA